MIQLLQLLAPPSPPPPFKGEGADPSPAAAPATLLLRRCLWMLSCSLGVAPLPAVHAPLLSMCCDAMGRPAELPSASPPSSPRYPASANTPVGVRLAACVTATQLLEATPFGDDALLPATIVGAVTRAVFSGVAACGEMDSALQLLSLLSALLGLVKPRTLLAVADAVLGPLPSLWEAAGANGSFLVRKHVLGVLCTVVGAIGEAREEGGEQGAAHGNGIPPAFMAALLPLITTSLEPGGDAVFLAGDALQLWAATLTASGPGGGDAAQASLCSLLPTLVRVVEAGGQQQGPHQNARKAGWSDDGGSPANASSSSTTTTAHSSSLLDPELVGPLALILEGYVAGNRTPHALLLSPPLPPHSPPANEYGYAYSADPHTWCILSRVCAGLLCAAPPRLLPVVLAGVDAAVLYAGGSALPALHPVLRLLLLGWAGGAAAEKALPSGRPLMSAGAAFAAGALAQRRAASPVGGGASTPGGGGGAAWHAAPAPSPFAGATTSHGGNQMSISRTPLGIVTGGPGFGGPFSPATATTSTSTTALSLISVDVATTLLQAAADVAGGVAAPLPPPISNPASQRLAALLLARLAVCDLSQQQGEQQPSKNPAPPSLLAFAGGCGGSAFVRALSCVSAGLGGQGSALFSTDPAAAALPRVLAGWGLLPLAQSAERLRLTLWLVDEWLALLEDCGGSSDRGGDALLQGGGAGLWANKLLLIAAATLLPVATQLAASLMSELAAAAAASAGGAGRGFPSQHAVQEVYSLLCGAEYNPLYAPPATGTPAPSRLACLFEGVLGSLRDAAALMRAADAASLYLPGVNDTPAKRAAGGGAGAGGNGGPGMMRHMSLPSSSGPSGQAGSGAAIAAAAAQTPLAEDDGSGRGMGGGGGQLNCRQEVGTDLLAQLGRSLEAMQATLGHERFVGVVGPVLPPHLRELLQQQQAAVGPR